MPRGIIKDARGIKMKFETIAKRDISLNDKYTTGSVNKKAETPIEKMP